MPEIPDSISSNFSELGRGPVGHFHPNGQPKLTYCAKCRASAMRDNVSFRCGCAKVCFRSPGYSKSKASGNEAKARTQFCVHS
jgi:hypothetical protein